jgi:DNA-binding MarR family transcriptional regulator
MQTTDKIAHSGECTCLLTDYPVSFAIFALARSHRARAGAMLAEIGLFPGQEILMMTIAAKNGESQKWLCDSIGLDHSTVAKSLTRLERCGLIERHKCSIDGRVTKIFITEKGRQATDAIAKVWANLEKLTVQDLTPEEQAQLIALSGKIRPHVE